MPLPVLIPLVLGVASMIGQNVQNKAAIKNNETQQAAAVQNAKDASSAAQNQVSSWLTSNPNKIEGGGSAPTLSGGPSPLAGTNGAPGAAGHQLNLNQLMATLPPQYKQMIQQISGGAGGGNNVPPPPNPTV